MKANDTNTDENEIDIDIDLNGFKKPRKMQESPRSHSSTLIHMHSNKNDIIVSVCLLSYLLII